MKNIVLIGMPASGKSTVAKHLAAKLSRPLVDIDTLIAETANLTIPEIFAQWGEPAFRDLESALTVQTAQGAGQVVATGGGVVLRAENMAALRETGLIFFLDRPLSALKCVAHEDRPLVGGDLSRLETLYTERRALYQNYGQYTVDNSGNATEAANQMLKLLLEAGEIT